jgi:DNA-binding SARP family transcriptional activator
VVVEFRILGPVDVVVDGQPLVPGGRRERTVLALLLLSLNRVVPSARLVDELWPASRSREALHSLRVAVSRLRRTLREAGSPELLLTQSRGYVVRVAPELLDLTRFESLVAQGRDQMTHGNPHRASVSFREALSIWRGPALTDTAEAPFARAESARLEEIRLTALEARVEADLACGRHAELPSELEALIRSYPLREDLWGQLMLALYRSGRQADALRAYQMLRRNLGEELGIEPSTRLAKLERAILRQEPALDWREVDARPISAGEGPGRRSLPDRTPFVGREAERSELRRLWTERPPDKHLAMVETRRGPLDLLGSSATAPVPWRPAGRA